ncbi:hypothetical protein C4F49_14040 [Sphingobacterium sp. KB22]|uniref:Uncharacterized protein n=1 Tax=Sphingobacterium hungaricum TaxID=2082723 RepID=A0A928UY29_9SPHI|nr:hypothetical protein [Sphingobacterium hungaricum]
MLLDEVLIQQGLNFENFIAIFSNINNLQYSPLNTIYYLLIYQINGYDAYYYHLFSILVHLLNGLALFKLLNLLFSCFNINNTQIISYIVVLIWLIHPLNVESVVWISASKIPLFSFFYFISFYYYIKSFLDKKKFAINYSLCIIAFIFSFLFKEQAVIIPVTFFIFSLIFQIQSTSVRYRTLFFLITPLFIISIIFISATLFALSYEGGGHPFDKYPLEKRLFFSFYSLGFYIFNSYLPLELKYHYAFPIKPDQSVPINLYVIAISLIILFISANKYLKKTKYYLTYIFMFLFFVIHLALCLHIIPLPRASIVADRYMYLALIGSISFIIIFITEYFKLDLSLKNRSNYIFTLILCLFIIGLAGFSYTLVESWFYRQI